MEFTRRNTIKSLAIGTLAGFTAEQTEAARSNNIIELEQIERWGLTHNRVWIGGEFWSNPMEDWRINDGWAQCQTTAEHRSLHSVTRQVTDISQSFAMSVELSRSAMIKQDGGAGFKLGVKSDLNEHRSNMFARSGIIAGVVQGELVLAGAREKLSRVNENGHIRLSIIASRKGDNYVLQLSASDPETNERLGDVRKEVPAQSCLGNICGVSQ